MNNYLKIFILSLLISLSFNLKAQIDTEFWFAAPDAIANHGDRPIILRISAFDKDAHIVLEQPANPNFKPIIQTILARTSLSIDLTNYISYIENAPADKILNFGLHLSSNSLITAYYEIANTSNSDIFTLKGQNGLGTSFYIPAQNDFDNQSNNFKAYNTFIIVASEDNTEVTIIPTKAVVGHAANQEFKIYLNKGQTYSVQAISTSKTEHLGGSKVSSNRPIAVTICDDSIIFQTCWDLVGEQLIPTNVIGKEYIAVKGFLNQGDRLYVLSTQDNTQIYFNGAVTPSAILAEGKQYGLQLTDPSVYIKASAPVYVLHVSGFGCEMGGTVLPPINCTGSDTMSFYRSSPDYFGLILFCAKGYEKDFLLNGAANQILASNFSPVPGTTDWMSARIDMTSSVLSLSTNVISNKSGIFNMGIINGSANRTCRYGYFSNFSSLNIGNDRIACQGDTVVLDAGRGSETYLWNTGETTQKIRAINNSDYWVKVKRGMCQLADTMKLTLNPLPKINFGNDTNICKGNSIRLFAPTNYYKYQWYNGNSGTTIQTDTTGLYWLNVVDFNNCKKTDSINVTVQNLPKITLRDTVFCEIMSTTISAKSDQYGKAKWLPLSGSPLIITQPDSFSTIVSANSYNAYSILFQTTSKYNCMSKDTMKIGFYKTPTSTFSLDSTKCYGENINVTYTGNASVNALYNWNFDDCQLLSGLNQGPYNIGLGASAQDKNLSLIVEEDGCKSLLSSKILKVRPSFSFKSDTIAGCEPLKINFTATTNKPSTNFKWIFSDSSSILTQNPQHVFKYPGKYDVTLLITAPNGCQNGYTKKEMITVYRIPTSTISLDSITCYPDTISLKYLGNASNLAHYNWSFSDISILSGINQGPFQLNIGKSSQLNLKLSVEENGCYSPIKQIKLKRIPHVNIYASLQSGCQPIEIQFKETNKEADMNYNWNIDEDTIYTQSSFTHLFKNYGDQRISLQVRSKTNGCFKLEKLAQPIIIYQKPKAEFSLQPKFTLIDNPSITFFNTSKNAKFYNWNYGDQSTSSEVAPVHLYQILGKFNVRLVATTEHSCSDTTYNDVTVGAFYAPNAFCPTSNIPENRIFKPLCDGMDLQDYVMMIFNRWGNKIYETKETSTGWDGTIKNGVQAEAGSYVWIISYKDIRGKLHKNSGYVVLLR